MPVIISNAYVPGELKVNADIARLKMFVDDYVNIGDLVTMLGPIKKSIANATNTSVVNQYKDLKKYNYEDLKAFTYDELMMTGITNVVGVALEKLGPDEEGYFYIWNYNTIYSDLESATYGQLKQFDYGGLMKRPIPDLI